MVNKNTLQSIISKYYLNGFNNTVKWRIQDNTLTVYAGKKGRVCKTVLKHFEFEDCELGIFDTNKLTKLLSITSGDLMLTPDKINKVYTKLHIADTNYDLTYSLADIFVIDKVSYVRDIEEYEIQLDLGNDDIDKLIKAKNALADQNNMLITSTKDPDGNPICEFIFGDNTGFSNKITYKMQGNITQDDIKIPFDADLLKDIFAANKDMESGKLKLSAIGLLKLEFTSPLIETEYFLGRNE